jgi:hypothetical protein
MLIIFFRGVHRLLFAMEELPEAVIVVGLRFGSFGGIKDGLGKLVFEFVHGERLSRPSSADG